MLTDRILVVGTTTDYIDSLERDHPGRCLFLTDPAERAGAVEAPPETPDEVLSPLHDFDLAGTAVADHLAHHHQRLDGIVCFDCESLPLAANLAERFGLRYPTPAAVALARNKLASKRRWQIAGLPCPHAALVSSAADAAVFMRRTYSPIVLKPLTGTGSELVFLCADERAAAEAILTMRVRLATHADFRMYAAVVNGATTIDPRQTFIAEQYVSGPEFSCDFVVRGDSASLIRCARKIRLPGQPPGTTNAYVVPGDLSDQGIGEPQLRTQLAEAAFALGIDRTICTVDFIACGGKAIMLELAPRLGGDCLPPLIRMSCGLDMMGFAIRFAAGDTPAIPRRCRWRKLVGLRLLSQRAGKITRIDGDRLAADPRVVRVDLLRRPGHVVTLPPDDYDSRILGHAFFRPASDDDIEAECVDLLGKLVAETEEQEARKAPLQA